ncbi:stargazin related protein STG-1 [Apis cerana cerana]|uniref:Stargazin related protein STG-1 n=1 Tax=Apis cerana cerana TaxID=94128 RepID=A0A2A3ECY2_APICC|nr:stargazin related protein STG-1 [Apis cerana cerana]
MAKAKRFAVGYSRFSNGRLKKETRIRVVSHTRPPTTEVGDENFYLAEITLFHLLSLADAYDMRRYVVAYVKLGSRMEYECSRIDYFPNEEYSPDPSDSTMAIPCESNSWTEYAFPGKNVGHYGPIHNLCSVLLNTTFKSLYLGNRLRYQDKTKNAVTKSAMFFFAATSLLVVAEVCYFTAHVTHPRHRLCVFVAGVVFIVSGLLMLVGMVMYISVFKAEVGSKLRPRSSFQGVYHLDNHHVHHANHHAILGHSGFLCERHQKRYFFGRDSVDHVDFDEFLPPPPNLDYHDYSRQFPRDLTTQTVSTTADVLQEEEEEYSPSVQHEFVTFDLDEPLPPPPPIRGGEWTFDTLRKTTPNLTTPSHINRFLYTFFHTSLDRGNKFSTIP